MTAYLLREGKESGQAIAYLQDGTMIVVEGGRKYIGNKIRIAVTSVLQTSAGRMIFAKVPKNHDVRDMLAGAEGNERVTDRNRSGCRCRQTHGTW